MSKTQRSLSIIFALFVAITLSSPAMADGKGPKSKPYSATDAFLGYIFENGSVPGTVTYYGPDQPKTVRGQKVLYNKVSENGLVQGLDLITFSANFDQDGSGPSFGTRYIEAGTWVSVVSCPVLVKGQKCFTFVYPEKAPYYFMQQIVFTPATNGCAWNGAFYSQLTYFGKVAVNSYAALDGSGAGCKGLTAIETGYTDTSTYDNVVNGTLYGLR